MAALFFLERADTLVKLAVGKGYRAYGKTNLEQKTDEADNAADGKRNAGVHVRALPTRAPPSARAKPALRLSTLGFSRLRRVRSRFALAGGGSLPRLGVRRG